MQINREEFLSRLELLQPGLSVQEVVEQSSCFVFDDGFIQTFNDEIACWIKSPVGITGAVSAAPLLKLLHKMKEEKIDIAVAGDELQINGKRRQAGIVMQKSVILQNDTVERPTGWRALPEDFAEAVAVVQACAGKDDSDFTMTCIHLHPKWIEACDTAQATRYGIETGLKESSLVRRDSLKHIVSLGMTHFAETATWIHFRNPARLVLSCRRWVEDYPSLKEILTVEGARITLPKGLAEAADRAGDFAEANDQDDQIIIELSEGNLNVYGSGSFGWYKEWKKIHYTGKQINFTISPKMMSEIVKRHTTCEITNKRLKVDGGKFVFVTCLGVANDSPKIQHVAEDDE